VNHVSPLCQHVQLAVRISSVKAARKDFTWLTIKESALGVQIKFKIVPNALTQANVAIV